MFQGLVCSEECPGGGYRDEDNGANTLIESSEESSVDGAILILVKLFIFGGLDACFEGVEGINKQVNGESRESSSLKIISEGLGAASALENTYKPDIKIGV